VKVDEQPKLLRKNTPNPVEDWAEIHGVKLKSVTEEELKQLRYQKFRDYEE